MRKKNSTTLDLFDSNAKLNGKVLNEPKTKQKNIYQNVPKNESLKSKKLKNSMQTKSTYTAKDIEVLEGLEPVRRRPGMYIGGTDERAMHHLAAEVLDNSMDEAVAGHADWIELTLHENLSLTICDNGRGIPVDAHPKFTDKSALEVILTTLHSGGKFNGNSYETSGGLHGVGLSVVNALSDYLSVEIARDRNLFKQIYSQGFPTSQLEHLGPTNNRRGTTITFHPDPKIFDKNIHFNPKILYRMALSKAYLFGGVKIRWKCDTKLLKSDKETPEEAKLHFPGGLSDFLISHLNDRKTIVPKIFSGKANFNDTIGHTEWAVAWPYDEVSFFNSYCNTVPTPLGGTHELGFRNALTRGIRSYGQLIGNKQSAKIMAEDIIGGTLTMLSVFIQDPQFQGQTKEKLSTSSTQKIVENAVGDHFEHWLSAAPDIANSILFNAIDRAEIRIKKRHDKQKKRQSPSRRLRLPGKLADCTQESRDGTELFIVEGDSAGGSAKQARNRATQAILPLRGKILNVASASVEKISQNQEINDLKEALGCGTRDKCSTVDLRYDKIIIMTDADVDGAHIASLLMTFFFQEMHPLVLEGHLYIALPPLYRLVTSNYSAYAMDENHKNQLMKDKFNGKKVEVSRFKGLGEMPPKQLRETAMDPAQRSLLRIIIPDHNPNEGQKQITETAKLVDQLMGKKPELRFNYIQNHAQFVSKLDI